MKNVLLRAGILFALAVAATSAAADPVPPGLTQDEAEHPGTVWPAKVHVLLNAKEFAQLTDWEKRSRDLDVRAEDGQPIRVALFAATGRSLDRDRTDCTPTLPGSANRTKDHERLWALMGEWRKHSPDSPGPRLAQASLMLDKAWVIRGCAYAKDIPADVWPRFNAAVADARRFLDALPEQDKRDGEWHNVNLWVSKLQGASPEELDRLYDKAVADANEYTRLHFAMASLSRREWSGSTTRVHQVAARSVQRPVKSGSHVLYARMQWFAEEPQMFRNGQADWSMMRRGLEQLIAAHPHPWNISAAQNFSCMGRDFGMYLELAERIAREKIRTNMAAWSNDQKFYDGCKAYAASIDAARKASQGNPAAR